MASSRAHRLPAPARRAGFTLVEILVVIVLLALLAAVALPGYREQLARSRRSEAQAALLEDAGYLQRYYAAHNAYSATPAPALTAPASPRTGPAAYRIAVDVPANDPTRFVLTAVRAGAMLGDRCGDFTYDNLGRRDLVPGTFDASASAAACWR